MGTHRFEVSLFVLLAATGCTGDAAPEEDAGGSTRDAADETTMSVASVSTFDDPTSGTMGDPTTVASSDDATTGTRTTTGFEATSSITGSTGSTGSTTTGSDTELDIQRCNGFEPCPDGLVCVPGKTTAADGYCMPPCDGDEDCPPGPPTFCYSSFGASVCVYACDDGLDASCPDEMCCIPPVGGDGFLCTYGP